MCRNSPTGPDADWARQEGHLGLHIPPSVCECHSATHTDAAPTSCSLLPHSNKTTVKLGHYTRCTEAATTTHHPPPTTGLTCDPGALVGMPVRLLAHCVGGCRRRVHVLDVQRVLLQVLFDHIQVHLGTGGGSRSAPGAPICTQPGHVRHLTHTEAGNLKSGGPV